MTVLAPRTLERIDAPAPPDQPDPPREVPLFCTLASFYFAIGCLLTLRYNLFDPDATSRVANAGYVTASRDPHLSAIGFVWNPLPSLVEIPILPFSRWWPALRTHGLAGAVQSALFMAAAAVMVGRIALDCQVGTRWRRIAIAAFALQPMIIVYGGSGMSEAAETFCLLWCVRRLMRWSQSRATADLAVAGMALGIGYLTRYEVLPAAIGSAVFVFVITVAAKGARRSGALANVAIVMFPIVIAAGIWALSGWVVNQELFATLTSKYGNDSIVRAVNDRSGPTVPAGVGDWLVVAARIFGMQPFSVIACGGAAVHAMLTRRVIALAPIVTFGPVLAFAGWGQLTSTTFGLFRYYLPAIPMVICVALAMAIPAQWNPPPARRIGAALLCASVLIGFPATVVASCNKRIGNQPLQFGFTSLIFPDRLTPEVPQQDWYRRLMIDDRLLADHLDRLHLADGAVLMDTFNTWGVWLNSSRPRQFVITSDFDFKAALNRPWEHGVQYLLVSNPSISDADALSVRYPSLWDDGAQMARLVYTVSGVDGEERFRLYRVTGPPKRLAEVAGDQISAGTP